MIIYNICGQFWNINEWMYTYLCKLAISYVEGHENGQKLKILQKNVLL